MRLTTCPQRSPESASAAPHSRGGADAVFEAAVSSSVSSSPTSAVASVGEEAPKRNSSGASAAACGRLCLAGCSRLGASARPPGDWSSAPAAVESFGGGSSRRFFYTNSVDTFAFAPPRWLAQRECVLGLDFSNVNNVLFLGPGRFGFVAGCSFLIYQLRPLRRNTHYLRATAAGGLALQRAADAPGPGGDGARTDPRPPGNAGHTTAVDASPQPPTHPPAQPPSAAVEAAAQLGQTTRPIKEDHSDDDENDFEQASATVLARTAGTIMADSLLPQSLELLTFLNSGDDGGIGAVATDKNRQYLAIGGKSLTGPPGTLWSST
eukprot:GHVT01006772.1.p1 GENE.GHVT01006772.1~~GHVT01006772.1.p1  ORF type:complete len:322 (+),score=73.52 GHVT01006772.1:847-1812(+)